MSARRSASGFESETDLAAVVVRWLKEQHWTVYQEVCVGFGCGVADIVATSGPVSWCIETKLTLSLHLMAQACDWAGRANFISIAIPGGHESSRARTFAEQLLYERGVGTLIVRRTSVDVARPARFTRRLWSPIAQTLCPEQLSGLPAGTKGGGYYTPFSGTCSAARAFVIENPGCSMKALVDGIRHHYASDATARSCLARWIREGIVPGIESRIESGKLRMFPAVLAKDRAQAAVGKVP